LYHLLTNQPPADARERFLNSDALLSPRQINPDISPRTERAILWAMSLHPDERPESVEQFREALVGNSQPLYRPIPKPTQPVQIILRSFPEQVFIWVAAGLAIVGILATLTH
jgi:serine/threonine-protein kinase